MTGRLPHAAKALARACIHLVPLLSSIWAGASAFSPPSSTSLHGPAASLFRWRGSRLLGLAQTPSHEVLGAPAGHCCIVSAWGSSREKIRAHGRGSFGPVSAAMLSGSMWGGLGGGDAGLGTDLLATDIVIVGGLVMAAIKAFEQMLKGRLGISSGVILSKLQVAVVCDSRGANSLLGALASLERSRNAFSQEECAARLAQAAARALLAAEADWVSAATLRQSVTAGAGLGSKVDDRQVQVRFDGR